MAEQGAMEDAVEIGTVDDLTEPYWTLLLLADPNRDMVNRYVTCGTCFSLRKDGRIAGVAALLAHDPSTIELMNIAIEARLQGCGLGKALLRHVIDFARDAGYQTMCVGTGNWPVDALAFYQRAGFRMVSIDSDYFTRHYPEPIIEDGIACRDRINLQRALTE